MARAALAEATFVARADALLVRCDPTAPAEAPGLHAGRRAMEACCEDLKTTLLAAGAQARLALPEMEQALRRCSALRRAAQQRHESRRRGADDGGDRSASAPGDAAAAEGAPPPRGSDRPIA